jgi:predicted  nucleic acid-binding Zn-ribbon protein
MRRPVVIDIETETDIERLRGAARAFQQQMDVLRGEIIELRQQMKLAIKRLNQLHGEVKKAERERIKALEERLKKLNDMLFGASTERRPHATPGATATAATSSNNPSNSQGTAPPQRGHGRRPQPNLPERIVEHT